MFAVNTLINFIRLPHENRDETRFALRNTIWGGKVKLQIE